MKKAFTLAEIMIVLTVIGILTAILLPVAFQAAPDEDIMKFKKANSMLATLIRELVHSDKYYADGDLGLKYDGTLLTADTDANKKYLCETLADTMSTKSVNCSTADGYTTKLYADIRKTQGSAGSEVDIATFKTNLDTVCTSDAAEAVGAEIVSADNITWYQATPGTPFGKIWNETTNTRLFSSPSQIPANYPEENGFDAIYKIFCIDVDGIGTGEEPFGYGIRADGRIIPGARADEWVKKSVQNNDD